MRTQAAKCADPVAFVDASFLHPKANVNQSLLSSPLPTAMLRWHQFVANWTGCPVHPVNVEPQEKYDPDNEPF